MSGFLGFLVLNGNLLKQNLEIRQKCISTQSFQHVLLKFCTKITENVLNFKVSTGTINRLLVWF